MSRGMFVLGILWMFLVVHDLPAQKVNPKEKKILICGVCKNIENSIPYLRNNFATLGGYFKDYKGIIYENNSTDATPKLLLKWMQNDRHMLCISENLSVEELAKTAKCFSWDNKPSRMEMIARARNIVLSEVRKQEYEDFDYVIMADLDFTSSWPFKEIVKTIRENDEWDCVSANGVCPDGEYYDRYALRTKQFPFGPELLGERWWQLLPHIRCRFKSSSGYVPVYSAFGGLAIYRRKSIIPFTYSGAVTEDLLQDTRDLLPALSPANQYVLEYVKKVGATSGVNPLQLPVVFCENSGYSRWPVCCEHITLHASMRRSGYGKIYINPRMVLVYK